jgi:hypothetical protein
VSKIRLSRVSVCGLLLIFFFLYLFLIVWKFQSPIYTTLSSLPICSHRATLGIGQTPHTSKELFIYLRKLYTEGITCVDVDIIKVFDGKVIIGHPTLVNREIGQGQDGPSIDTLFSFLKEFPKATATLELKGDLRDDIEFAKKLYHEAKSYTILNQIAVEGQPRDFTNLRTFVALRDRNGPEIGARCGLPLEWKFGNSLSTDEAIRNIYESIKGADVILPSSICFEERVVKEAIELWIIDHTQKDKGQLIHPWVYDTTESAISVLKNSKNNRLQDVTKVISNEPILIAKALRYS